jgi:hypothetical protein
MTRHLTAGICSCEVADLGGDSAGVIVTSNPEHQVTSAARAKANLEELFRGVRPIQSVDELAAPEIFESDDELDEFLTAVRAHRNVDLA